MRFSYMSRTIEIISSSSYRIILFEDFMLVLSLYSIESLIYVGSLAFIIFKIFKNRYLYWTQIIFCSYKYV